MKPNESGLRRIVSATAYSMLGIRFAWVNEAAFRQEALLALILIPVGLWLGESGTERAILVASCLIVLITELLNSAIEAIVDRIGTEHHELSGAAKDLGSAAVFFSLSLVVIVWTLILWDTL